jgi:hypothetical protein
MSQQDQIKDLIRKEYIACASDPAHFAKKYCYISHPVRGRVLFNLYPFQEKTLKFFYGNNYTVINKSRQLGISTLVAMYSLWIMLFNKDKTILVIATKQETAKSMVTKVKYMYDNLPSWLKGKKAPLEDNALSLKLANGSLIVATASSSDAGRSYAASLLIIDEAAFIADIDRIYTSIKPTLATGGGCIALSSPNGVGNWFHRKWEDALMAKGDFIPLELKWDVHPERDAAWFAKESANMTSKEIAQEYCCDFLASGNTLVDPSILSWYENAIDDETGEKLIREPIEKSFLGNDYWVWKKPDLTKQYVVCADVARGDGNDYSSFHVIDAIACEQVAEYKSQIGTREYGNMLVTVAAYYNNALLVIENSNIGWDVINTAIEKGYPHIYYSPRAYGELDMEKYLYKVDNGQTVPGFTMSAKTRPLAISKVESYMREKALKIHSKRLLGELRVFVWINGKAQAQNQYNDDLVLSLAAGLFIRDTALNFYTQGINQAKASLGGMSKESYGYDNGPSMPHNLPNPWELNMGNFGVEDITWLL